MKRRHLITEYKHVLCIKAEDYCLVCMKGLLTWLVAGSTFVLLATMIVES